MRARAPRSDLERHSGDELQRARRREARHVQLHVGTAAIATAWIEMNLS